MAKILILETDPVSAALLEDRLVVTGHTVTQARDAATALAAAQEGDVNLLLLEMELPVSSGLEVIRQLRARSSTRALPVVALSRSSQSADRIAALRAGADDFLSRPFDVEELLLRADRLLGSRGGAVQPVMQGDLASHPSWELVQYIQQAGKSGELVIHGPRGAGRLRVRDGRAVQARYRGLAGSDALLAILDLREGQFRLTPADESDTRSDEEEFSIPEVLMEAAWLHDELAKRRRYLPATGVPLGRTSAEPPALDGELSALPFTEVLARLERQPPPRLYDLVSESRTAPVKVRLAVAWLIEHGAAAPQELEEPALSTSEITSSMVLDLAVHGLLDAARGAGFDVAALPYLILAEPGVRPELLKMLVGGPGYPSHDELARLAKQLELRQGGSAELASEVGTLSLHVQVLTPAVKAQVEAIAPLCAGVLVWLGDGASKELIRGVVRRLEAVAGGVGVMVAPSPAGRELAAELVAGCRRWSISGLAPQSLIGVLRLLHPRAAAG